MSLQSESNTKENYISRNIASQNGSDVSQICEHDTLIENGSISRPNVMNLENTSKNSNHPGLERAIPTSDCSTHLGSGPAPPPASAPDSVPFSPMASNSQCPPSNSSYSLKSFASFSTPSGPCSPSGFELPLNASIAQDNSTNSNSSNDPFATKTNCSTKETNLETPATSRPPNTDDRTNSNIGPECEEALVDQINISRDRDPDSESFSSAISEREDEQKRELHSTLLGRGCFSSAFGSNCQGRHYRRTRLPAPQLKNFHLDVLKEFKKALGKELYRISLPLTLNEPITILQRISEFFEYAHLLHQADRSPDVVDRMSYIAAWMISTYSSSSGRLGKPFNPLLGETYEHYNEELGWRLVAEQVSHHPPVSAFHFESPFARFYGNIHPKLQVKFTSLTVKQQGVVTLEMINHKEVYVFSTISANVHNLLFRSKMWIENVGIQEASNPITGHKIKIIMKAAGKNKKDLNFVEAHILDPKGKKLRAFYGKWDQNIFEIAPDAWDLYVKTGHSLDVAANGLDTSEAHILKVKNGIGKNGASEIEGRDDADQENNTFYDVETNEQFTAKEYEYLDSNGAVSHISNIDEDASATGTGTDSNSPTPDSGLDRADMNSIEAQPTLYDLSIPGQRLVWAAVPRPATAGLYYNWNYFVMSLNEYDTLPDYLKKSLPPTDSRLRPDMRLLEFGEIDKASDEKERIEVKQRTAAAERKKKKQTWTPRWFEQRMHPHTGQKDWIYKGTYLNRDWTTCPDIF